MDIIIFTVSLVLGFVPIIIDFYRKVPYMGVFGGIVLILLGIFLAVDGGLTMLVCS